MIALCGQYNYGKIHVLGSLSLIDVIDVIEYLIKVFLYQLTTHDCAKFAIVCMYSMYSLTNVGNCVIISNYNTSGIVFELEL